MPDEEAVEVNNGTDAPSFSSFVIMDGEDDEATEVHTIDENSNATAK